MSRKSANKGISRIDSGSTHGWFVRVYRNAKTYSKLFSDRKCGGKGKAQKRAKEYRDQLTAEVEAIPRCSRQLDPGASNNTTGDPGVFFVTQIGPRGVKHDCYAVIWHPEPGVEECTYFSIKTFGETRAFNKAVEFRFLRKFL